MEKNINQTVSYTYLSICTIDVKQFYLEGIHHIFN